MEVVVLSWCLLPPQLAFDQPFTNLYPLPLPLKGLRVGVGYSLWSTRLPFNPQPNPPLFTTPLKGGGSKGLGLGLGVSRVRG